MQQRKFAVRGEPIRLFLRRSVTKKAISAWQRNLASCTCVLKEVPDYLNEAAHALLTFWCALKEKTRGLKERSWRYWGHKSKCADAYFLQNRCVPSPWSWWISCLRARDCTAWHSYPCIVLERGLKILGGAPTTHFRRLFCAESYSSGPLLFWILPRILLSWPRNVTVYTRLIKLARVCRFAGRSKGEGRHPCPLVALSQSLNSSVNWFFSRS